MRDFSVLMSIYKNTKLAELEECLNSIFDQSVRSNDVVIVFDGPVAPEVELYLDDIAAERTELNLIKREQNCGQGIAVAAGMEHCKNELIARMDSDDVCAEGRFELQLKAFEEHPDCAVIGGNMAEFVGSIDNVRAFRSVPENHDEICEFMKKRCPFNQITVMLKKSAVENVGGYKDWYCDEDYYLWIRMYLAGCKFYNVRQVLAYARVDSMMTRRGGKRYYKSERDLFKFMRKHKMISAWQYFKAKTVRYIAYVLLPDSLRQKLFDKFVREKK